MKIDRSILIDIYICFAERIYGKKYVVEKASDSLADTFLALLSKRFRLESLGEDFLWTYTVFQFNYWRQLTISSFDGRMKFAYVFGRKALNRYLERNEDFDWTLDKTDLFVDFSKSKFFAKCRVVEQHFDIEAEYRKRFVKTEDCLVNCILLTSLYDPSDKSCQQCAIASDCCELLRMNYPHIYNQRIKKS